MTPDKDTLPILACAPTDRALFESVKMPPFKPHAGSVAGKCELCEREVWIGPRQAALRLQRTCVVVCWICAIKGGARGENIQTLGGP